MKNKKGFTLIELLAVIIIIGLLVIIAFPAVSKYLIDTENDTYSLHEAELKSATANMMSKCIEGNVKDCVPDNGESRTVYLNELIAQKFSLPLKDPANTNNYCSASDTYVVVTNSTNNMVNLDYQVCLVCSEYKSPVCETIKPNDVCDKETDSERPLCSEAIGASTVWTNADRIISIGCSDTGCGCTQGTFYKRFEENTKQGVITVVDKAGNYTDCVVDVYVDKEVPTCSLTVEGNLGENGWYGGDAPVVKLNYNDTDISGIATYGMGLSSKNYDLNKKTSYTVSSGITTVYGYVKDNAGNVGICSVPIKYDPVVPTGEITYGYQVYPKSDIATVDGRNIKLNHFISEYGNVLGANIYLKSNTSGMSVTIYKGSTEIAKRTISAGVTFMKFSFVGNYDSLTIDMGSSSNVSLIERVELITDQTTSGFYTNKDVIVYATSKDSFSGKGYYSFDGKDWQTSNAYTYESNVVGSNTKIKDFAGNSSDLITFDITNIDKEVPSCNITTEFEPDGKNKWFISNFDLDLHTSDVGVSNVRDYNITTNSSPSYATVNKATQTEDTKFTTWYGYVRDKAGNVNKCSVDVKLDKVNPTCKVKVPEPDGENSWYITDVVVDYTVFDETSGIEFRGMNISGIVDYNDVRSMNLNYETKTENFYCYVEDESGRTNQDVEPYKLDKENPTCVITPDRAIDGENGWYRNNVNLKFTTTSDISPIIGYDFIDSETFSYSNKRNEHNITSSTKGVTYYGYTKEESGRTSSCELFVKMDKDKPTCTLTAPAFDGENGWYVNDIKFTLTPSDPISGIKNTGIVDTNTKTYNDKLIHTHTADMTGIMYYGFVKDEAGNENTCDSTTARKKDSTPPDACTLLITSGDEGDRGWYVSDVGLGLKSTPKDSGPYASGIQGYDVVVSGNSPIYSHKHKTFTVTANSTSTSGTKHIAYIKDNAGNVTECERTVWKDDEAPVCSLYVVGTSGNHGWYRSAVTFNLDVFDNSGNDASNMYQYGVSTSSSPDYNSRTTYDQGTQTSGKTVYCYVEDLAGNVGSSEETVKIDWTAPSCKIGVTEGTKGTGVWYNSYKVVLSFVDGSGSKTTPTDSSSGIDKYHISNSSTPYFYSRRIGYNVYSNTPSSGRAYYGHVKDKAGNTSRCSLTLYKDSIAPSCSLTISSGTKGENGWYRGNSVGVKGSPYGEYGNNSGISSFDVTTSSSPTYSVTYGSSTYKIVYQYDDTNGTDYYCHVKDNAGNSRTTSALTIKKDSVAPSCSLTTDKSWFGTDYIVWSDKSGSSLFGISKSTAKTTYNGLEKVAILEGDFTYYGYVKDDAGNTNSCSTTSSHSSIWESSCSLSFDGETKINGWRGTGILSVGDNEIYNWTVNGVDKGSGKTLSLSSDGQYYVEAKRSVAVIGTVACSMMINIDTTPPDYLNVSLSKTATQANPSSSYLYATLTSSDATSGLATWGYNNGSGWQDSTSSTSPYRWYFFGEKNHSGQFRVCDVAGNCRIDSTTYSIYIDYCSEDLLDKNYSAYGTCKITCDGSDPDCSSTCGSGEAIRYNTWTGDSGATCKVEDRDECFVNTGCKTSHSICSSTTEETLFGHSVGNNKGNKNYESFYSRVPTGRFWCDTGGSDGCWSYTGVDRVCSDYNACGKYYNETAAQMIEDDIAYSEENKLSTTCNFRRYWCTCNENYLLGYKGVGDNRGGIYSKWYGD